MKVGRFLLLASALGSIGLVAACGAPAASEPVSGEPIVTLAPDEEEGPPPDDAHILSVKAFRINKLTALPGGALQLDVIGPPKTTYRLRSGKKVDSCQQVQGAIQEKPPAGFPVFTVSNVVVKCAESPAPAAVRKNSVLLMTVDTGDGFRSDFEVPVDSAL
jgi:hypothetical protein